MQNVMRQLNRMVYIGGHDFEQLERMPVVKRDFLYLDLIEIRKEEKEANNTHKN